ncbi:MAG TPA: lipocalin family protein [bacterium]|nr:lipocalin family protein [bacterium]
MRRITITAMTVVAAAVMFAAPAPAQVSLTLPLINLPDDEKPHAGSPVEEWRLCGVLQDDEGRRYGVSAEYVIARRGGMPPAHFIFYSLTEKAAGKFHGVALMDKAGAELAAEDSAAPRPEMFDANENEKSRVLMKKEPVAISESLGLMFDGNYFVNEKSPGRDWEDWRYGARLAGEGFEVELEMKPERGPLFMGGAGSAGLNPDENFLMYSFARMTAKGELRIGGEARRARGALWYDHKYGAAGAAGKNAGWEWFRVQMEDGTDINLFVARRPDTGERFHRMATIKWADGRVSVARDIVLEPLSWRKSSETGIVYPVEWAVAAPSLRAHLTIRQDMPYQETKAFGPARGGTWAGFGSAEAVIDGERLSGDVFTELAGYGAGQGGALP